MNSALTFPSVINYSLATACYSCVPQVYTFTREITRTWRDKDYNQLASAPKLDVTAGVQKMKQQVPRVLNFGSR